MNDTTDIGGIITSATRAIPPPDPEPAPARTTRREGDPDPVAVVWPSRSGGEPHVVGLVDDPRHPTLTCTCRAYLTVLAGGRRGCWAMQATRSLLGWAEPDDEERR